MSLEAIQIEFISRFFCTIDTSCSIREEESPKKISSLSFPSSFVSSCHRKKYLSIDSIDLDPVFLLLNLHCQFLSQYSSVSEDLYACYKYSEEIIAAFKVKPPSFC